MPTLRFSRDRRGYESTYLLHSSRRRTGPEHPQLLYWFRSPPHVKVGRAAFDEDAIRVLEEQHPDVEFDWDRILTTKPPAAPEARDPRDARAARRPERRPAREGRREPAGASPQQSAVLPPPTPPEPAPLEAASPPPAAPSLAVPPSTVEQVTVPVGYKEANEVGEPTSITEPVAATAPTRRFVRVFDAPAGAPTAPEHHASAPSVVERMLGAEQLTVLRARHAEILARISARGGDPARVEALREQAASVDPDGWVTESDVTAGLASLDATLLELHRIVGRRRRRRRRRRDGGSAQPPVSGSPDNPAAAEDAAESETGDESEPDGTDDGPDE